ncbi:unnamed protein product [Sphagnum compactum]
MDGNGVGVREIATAAAVHRGARGRRGESGREICLWRLCTRRRFVVAVAEARGSLSMSLVDSFNSSSSCFGEELLLDVRD